MKLRQVRIVFFKEMLETLRDKRTLMVMVLGPVLIYPILILVLTTMTRAQHVKLEQEPSLVILSGGSNNMPLAERLDADEHIDLLRPREGADPKDDVRSGNVHAAVIITKDVARPGTATGPARDLTRVAIIHNPAVERSDLAVERIRRILRDYSRDIIAERVAVLANDEEYRYPLVVKEESVGTPEAVGRRLLGYAVPMMLVLMTIAGSMYPAIDTTAGEKERGTIETILTTPAGIAEIVGGKFLTVFVIAIATGLLNLAGMGLSLAAIGTMAEAQIDLSLPIDAALLMLVFIVPLAFLFSSVMMAVAMYARTFKEAQNYATPIYLLTVIPAMMSMLPAFELTLPLCLVPVVGVTLLLKELVQGTVVAGHLALVFVSTSLYAFIALRLTIRLFHDENVLFSSERPFALFVGRKRLKPRPLPTPGEAMFLTAVCFILFFLLGQVALRLGFRSGTTITMWGLIFLPAALFAYYLRLDPNETFLLRPRSRVRALVGLVAGVAAGAAAIVVGLETQILWSQIVPTPDELASEGSNLLRGLSVGELLLFIAVFPAICEELLFRGFILGGLSTRLGRWKGAIVVGLLFALFHIVPVILNIVPVVQIVLGIALGLLAAYSGSIYSSMVCHFTYNAGLILLGTFSFERGWLAELARAAELKGHVPAPLLALAVIVLVGAIGFVVWLGRDRPRA